MNIYDLSRSFWDYAFENPDKVRPNHCALFFFVVEHCNRLGWKQKFGLPTTMAMEAVGIKSYNTYINTFNDLVDWGLLIIHERSKNQYSSNVIELSKFDKAFDKALDKALIKHTTKQSESTQQSTQQSIDSIDIQYTNIQYTNLQDTILQEGDFNFENPDQEFFEEETMDLPRTLKAEDFKKEKVPEKRKSQQLEILDQCQLPFQSDRFIKYWLLFLEYKQKMKKPYTSILGMQAALKKCSNYSEDIIIQALTESMSNGWQGFFPEKIKTNANGKSQQQTGISLTEQFNRLRAKAHSGSWGQQPYADGKNIPQPDHS